MRRPHPALLLLVPLLLPLLLIGCQRPPVVVSDQQRAACRSQAESAATPEEALKRNAACLDAAIEELKNPPPPSPPPVVAAAPPPAAPIDRYRYCLLHQDDVQAASARLTNVAKPLMVASKSYAPESEEFREAQQAYDAALAELERLLPPEIRNGMDLMPTAAEAYSLCDRQVIERTPGP